MRGCGNSDLTATIIIDGLGTQVANQPLSDSCIISDQITQAANEARNHGGLVQQATHLATEWVRQGLITNVDRASIVNAAVKGETGMPKG
jgi:hypothetical protein